MKYRTFWSYLRFPKQTNEYYKIPMLIIQACRGEGLGAKLLTEIEGEILEILIAGEQGVVIIDSFKDLEQYFCPNPGVYDSLDCVNSNCNLNDEIDNNDLLNPESLLKALESIQNKGFVKFKDDFFV